MENNEKDEQIIFGTITLNSLYETIYKNNVSARKKLLDWVSLKVPKSRKVSWASQYENKTFYIDQIIIKININEILKKYLIF
mgnify:CR=1 FL=1